MRNLSPTTRLVAASAVMLACCGASGCAVKSVYVKPDFEQIDRQNLKRVVVSATPIPGQPDKAAELLASMSLRHVNQHKDYLAVDYTVLPEAAGWKALCKSEDDEEIHGVVRVMVARLLAAGGDLTVEMTADLQRCDSGVQVWKVEIDDTNDQKDDDLKELANVYRKEFGALADALAAPFFLVIRAAFDSLPSPVLTDEETMEKIELE